MRIVIIEQGQSEYLDMIFKWHPDFRCEIVSYAQWEPSMRMCDGIPVIPIEELKGSNYDAILVLVSANRFLSRLLAYLHEKEIDNIFVVRLHALDKKTDFISSTGFNSALVDKIPAICEKPYLVHLETHICDHCNLNCKACNNFAPFCKEENCASVEQFDKDLEKLSMLFSNIGRLFLLGGEPLLEPDLCRDFFSVSRKYFPNSELRLLTNGLLIPKMNKYFWDAAREYNVIIHISVYPPTLKILTNIEEILTREQVKWVIAKQITKFGKRWTNAPLEDAQKNNYWCGSSGCHYLRDGKISKCPDAELIRHFDAAFGTRLESHDFMKLDEVRDGWQVIDQLNRPIDLCSYCTHERLELVDWESVGTKPEASQWLVKNRFEFEQDKWAEYRVDMEERKNELIAQLEDARNQETQLMKSLSEAEEKKSQLTAQLEEANKNCAELSVQLNENNERLKKEIDISAHWQQQNVETRRELVRIKRMLAETEGKYQSIRVSVSFRIGRVITWLPRKGRACISNLRTMGGKRLIKKYAIIVAEKILPNSILKMYQVFRNRMLAGFSVYSNIIKEYGHDVTILGNAIKGTGDYYICGQYLKGWLEKNGITKYVFLTLGGSQQAVTNLFDVYNQHTYVLSFYQSLLLRDFRGFVGTEKQNFVFLDHQNPFPSNRNHNISTGNLMGFRGLNICDFYLFFGLGLTETAPKQEPMFANNVEQVDKFFSDPNFIRGKTVLLSPYSESNAGEYQPPSIFWEELVKSLLNMGYYVYTNCAGNETAITGTTPLFLPYTQTVPFLNEAGYFIGFRSGLCDIVSTSTCKKIVLHARKTRFWPEGASIAYTGLNNMGLCDQVVELEISSENVFEVLDQVVHVVLKE